MSNLVCITICILISFIMSAVFMSCYKEDISDEIHTLRSRLNDAWDRLHVLQDETYIWRAKCYDMEQKLKEMETTNDGK